MGNHAGRKYLDGEWNGLTITVHKTALFADTSQKRPWKIAKFMQLAP